MNALFSLFTAMGAYLHRDWNHASGERGRPYAQQGRVLRFVLRGNSDGQRIEAAVKGKNRDPYLVDLILFAQKDHPQLITHCSCPMYGDCKHCFAAVMAFMAAAWRGMQLEDPPTPEMAEAVRRSSAALPGDAFQSAAAVRATLIALDVQPQEDPLQKQIITQTSGPAELFAFAPQPGFVLKRDLFDRVIAAWGQRQSAGTALEGLIRELLIYSRESHRLHDTLDHLLRMESPYDALRAFPAAFARAAKDLRLRTHEWQADFMQWIDSAEFDADAKAWLARHAASELEAWMSTQHGVRGTERLRARFCIVTASQGLGRLYFELLMTSAKLRDEPRHPPAIENLMTDVRNGKRHFAPAQQALLRAVSGGDQYTRETARDNERLLAVNSALGWMARWCESGLLTWEDETVPRLVMQVARLRPRTQDHQGERIEWEILWPSGAPQDPQAPIPLSEAVVFHDGVYGSGGLEQATIFIRRGAWFARLDVGEMPLHVFSLLRRTGSIARAALEEGRAALLIERLGLGQEARNTGLVEEIPVTPIVELHAEGADRIRLVARADAAEGIQFVWITDDVWRPVDSRRFAGELEVLAAPAEAESVAQNHAARPDSNAPQPLTIQPRPEDVEPVQAWLNRVLPAAEYTQTGAGGLPAFVWSIDRNELSRLYRLIRERPAGLRVLASAALARKLRPLALRPPRVSVEGGAPAQAWLTVQVAWEPEMESLSEAEIRSALAATAGDLIELPGGRTYLRDDVNAYFAQRETLERAGLIGKGPQRLHALQAAGLDDDLLELIEAEGNAAGGFAQRTRELVRSFKGIPPAYVPKPTAAWLRPYQRLGVDFLVWAAQSIGGALLADDMGLGKTLQLLAALAALRAQEKDAGPSLIICPASVVQNWRREAERFVPGLRICVLERGSNRHALLDQLNEYDVVIKNFTLARIEVERLRAYDWFAICVDEAQAIKNPAAATTVAIKSLSARYRFALTGTPVENRVTDLWSIVQFVAPGWLGPLRDLERHINGVSASAVREGLRARLRPVLLRRLKQEVAPELPPRIEERLDCEMPPAQRKAYLAEVKHTRELLAGLDGRQAGQARIRMLAALTRLRQLCCDPGLLGIEPAVSGKVDELLNLLPELLEAGHKVLVFSQFVRMLERLRPKIETLCPSVWMLTGKTRAGRQDIIDSFEQHDGPGVFMISLKAGGTGLNLITASHVILFDPWWNPAVEAQAIDRSHRIGQTQSVVALRLITKGTIEERITELQERKKDLIQTLVGDEAFAQTLTREDFAFLLQSPETQP